MPDVVDALHLARHQDLELSVRGGGPNVAGKAVTDGGVMIDLAPMKGVRVEPASRTVWAQGGVVWREFNRAAAAHGLATTGGVVSTTGIAGLTLGAGEGWLMGRCGMAIDNLLSAEVVTADGDIVSASEEVEPDLFWALRGGGGNFRIVTSFEFRAHPIATVLGGVVAHPLSVAGIVLDRYAAVAATAPDELTTFLALVHDAAGTGAKLVATPLCHSGDDPDRAEAEVEDLRSPEAGGIDLVDRIPYPAMNTLLDAAFPPGTLNYWKSAFLRDLTPEAFEVMVESFERCPSPLTNIVIAHYRGATSRVAPTATAFPHRGPGFSPVILSQWLEPADTDANISWTRETYEALRPHTTDKVYVNNLAGDEPGAARDAYGQNWDRLVALKRRYDPENVFRLNTNIDPR